MLTSENMLGPVAEAPYQVGEVKVKGLEVMSFAEQCLPFAHTPRHVR